MKKYKYLLLENKKIILWLDDVRNPEDENIIKKYMQDKKLQQVLKEKYKLVWVKTIAEALPYIQNNQVTHVSFDHDLSNFDENKEELSGYILAKQIEEMAYNKEIESFTWDVHSDNPSGKKNIINAMKSADRYWDVE